MKTQDKSVNEETLLRIIAEDELHNHNPSFSEIAELDNRKLIHELQVHQIELEMQNEELKIAHQQAYESIEKYVELYDRAPSGYLTLSKSGDILELNISAAEMLGKNSNKLRNTRFGLHISHDSLSSFNKLLDKTFRLNVKESSELILLHKTDKVDNSLCVLVDAQLSKDRTKCMFTMTDISELKKIQMELKRTIALLREHNL